MSQKMNSRVEGDRTLVLEREFDAPVALLFDMFKKAEHLKHWWGPRGWEVPYCTVDFKAGGVWRYCMKCVDKNQGNYFGMEAWGKGVYSEIVEPKKIIYTDYFTDAEGKTNTDLPATDVDMDFIDLNAKSKLVSRSQYKTAADLKTVMDMGMLEGITQTWDRLEERLATVKKGI